MKKKEVSLMEEVGKLLASPDGDTLSEEEAVQIVMKKREIKKRHPKPIFFSPSEGRWQTQILVDGKWKVKKWTHEKDLYQFLDNYYTLIDNPPSPALAAVYEEWHSGRMIERPATAAKDQWIWETYYKDTPLASRQMQDLTVEDIKDALRQICIDHGLTLRKLREAKTLLNGVFAYAYERCIVDDKVPQRISRMGDWACIKTEEEKTDDEERFLLDEAVQVCSTAVRLYHETGESIFLAIPLSFQIGVRAGEMVCLHFGDIQDGILTLQRQEVQNYVTVDGALKKKGYKIVPWLKKKKKRRTVPLTASALAVIDMLRQYNAEHGLCCGPDNPIFQREDGSVWHTDALHRRQSSTCKEAGLLHRSFHKIRKTWISELLTFKAIPVTTVRDLAGHSDARVTLNVYGKSVLPDSKIRSDMESVLPSLDLSDASSL